METYDTRTLLEIALADVFEIPGYTILEKIGTGSTATVWRARQESLDREVAIKVMHPELWKEIEEADAFLAEAQSVAQLRSRHIIQVYDTGHLDHTAYIVLEYVPGSTVAEHLTASGKMAPREAMQITAAIADALANAWDSAGIIHRDVKPENIIIENDGSVKLADLGLARRENRAPDQTGSACIVGTPNYMSPEQAQGATDISIASDMYSLGATLYHMLTGKLPFAGLSVEEVLDAQIHQQLQWPQDIDSHIPTPYCQFVARLMMKKPQDRFANWNVVYHDAAKLAEGRMMMIKLPAGSESTVASAGKISTGQKKVIKINKSKSQVAAPAVPARSKIPGWLTRTLRLSRAAMMLAILWFFLLQPILNSLQEPAPAAATPSPTPAPITRQPEPRPPTVDPTIADEVDEYDRAETQPHEPEIPAVSRSERTKHELLTLLVQQQYAQALQFWAENKTHIGSTLRQDIISEFMLPANMPDAMMRDALNRYTQRTLDLQIGGETATIQVESMDGDTVQAMRVTQTGASRVMRPISFRISLLPYPDQLRLVQQTANPYAPHGEVLVALQGADYETALQKASQMGPLADVVTTFAQERIDILTQR